MSNYIIHNGTLMSSELYHHGVKGMKWGRRRYQNKDGSLTPAGIKRYAKKAYADEAHKNTKSIGGKAYNKLTGAHKYEADIRYDSTSNKQNKAVAEKYASEKKADARKKAAKVAAKGAEVASKAALYSMADDIFYDGAGKKIAKEAVVQTGRAAVTAYMMARGGYDIKWYDKNGRRVG